MDSSTTVIATRQPRRCRGVQSRFWELRTFRRRISPRGLGYNNSDIQQLLDTKILTLHVLPSLDKCFQMLEANRVDLVPVNEWVGKAMIHSLYGPRENIFRTLDKPLDELTVSHLIVSK